jgi:hypothetical protein
VSGYSSWGRFIGGVLLTHAAGTATTKTRKS